MKVLWFLLYFFHKILILWKIGIGVFSSRIGNYRENGHFYFCHQHRGHISKQWKFPDFHYISHLYYLPLSIRFLLYCRKLTLGFLVQWLVTIEKMAISTFHTNIDVIFRSNESSLISIIFLIFIIFHLSFWHQWLVTIEKMAISTFPTSIEVIFQSNESSLIPFVFLNFYYLPPFIGSTLILWKIAIGVFSSIIGNYRENDHFYCPQKYRFHRIDME